MTFKTFLAEATILEGGAAIKGSHPLTQAEAREISMQVVRDLKVKLNLPSSAIAAVGSAGLKAPDQLSGDIDIAVEADVTLVKTAVEQLALNGQFRHMPGLNVYSFARLHGSKVAQVDIIPTTNLKLAKWAYYNDPQDLKLGLKGSHRNELLFAIAKYAEYKVTAKAADGTETARTRLAFDLSRGLYRSTQDKAGKRGITKSFKTTDKALITSDPDKICSILFGAGVGAKQVMTYADAFKLMMASSFPHKAQLKQILQRAVEGLEGKKLVVPHELRQACTTKLNEASTLRQRALMVQTGIVNALSKHNVKIEDGGKEVVVYDHANVKVYSVSIDMRMPSDDSMLPAWVKLQVDYAERAVFTSAIRGLGFGMNYDRHMYEFKLEDRLLQATVEQPFTIYVCTHERFAVEYVRVRDVELAYEAVVYAKHADISEQAIQKSIAHRTEKIFEAEEYGRKVMLKLQQLLIDLDLPRCEEASPVRINAQGQLTASYKCDDEWTLTAHQLVHDKNPHKLSITIASTAVGHDIPIEYIIRRGTAAETRLQMFVNGGMLTNGDDSEFFETWEEALTFFMKEFKETFDSADGLGPH